VQIARDLVRRKRPCPAILLREHTE
jgi:hypothetical protein